jgi:hypothetical protein
MAHCGFCHQHVKVEMRDDHHVNFPESKYRGTPGADKIVSAHIKCHQAFHKHFEKHCMIKAFRRCEKCRYYICIYNTAMSENKEQVLSTV